MYCTCSDEATKGKTVFIQSRRRFVRLVEHHIIDSEITLTSEGRSASSSSDPMEHISSTGVVSPCLDSGLVLSRLVLLAAGSLVSNIRFGDHPGRFESFDIVRR